LIVACLGWVGGATDSEPDQGAINNEHEKVKNVGLGQWVSAEPAKISGWMSIEKRKPISGSTIRILRGGVPAGDRAEFDEGVPFVIE
jgi:uncharacterized protein YegJ (DUF2314 family)